MDQKLKILITDDSALLRRKLRQELEAMDIVVMEAENGKAAIIESLKDKPDGIILDVIMPEVNGIEALRAIKEIDPHMPVVMLSSVGTQEKILETMQIGALDFIQKPYTKEQIQKSIENIRKRVLSYE